MGEGRTLVKAEAAQSLHHLASGDGSGLEAQGLSHGDTHRRGRLHHHHLQGWGWTFRGWRKARSGGSAPALLLFSSSSATACQSGRSVMAPTGQTTEH